MPSYRKARLEHQIMRIVGNLLLTEVKDPRVEFVSVSRVAVSPDYSRAEVYYSVLGDEKKKRDALFGLKSAKGYIKKRLGNSLSMRIVPDVIFTYDDSVEKGVDLVNLIETAANDMTTDDETDASPLE